MVGRVDTAVETYTASFLKPKQILGISPCHIRKQ